MEGYGFGKRHNSTFFSPFFWDMAMKNGSGSGLVVGGCSACSICFGGMNLENLGILLCWLFFPLCENATEV